MGAEVEGAGGQGKRVGMIGLKGSMAAPALALAPGRPHLLRWCPACGRHPLSQRCKWLTRLAQHTAMRHAHPLCPSTRSTPTHHLYTHHPLTHPPLTHHPRPPLLHKQVGLHTLGPGGKPLVAHVTLEGDEGLQADLAEAVPLNDVLAQVGASKAAMLAAIEGLEPEPPVGGGVERYLGAALRAVLRWVATGAAEAAEAGLDQQQQHAAGGISHGGAAVEAPMQQQWQAEEAQQAAQQEPQEGAAGSPAGPTLPPASGFPGMRLLVFLSGPPNCGAGAVVSRRPPPLSPQAAAAAAQLAKEAAKDVAFLVLDPVYPELSSWSGESEIQQGAREQQAAAAEAAAAAAAAAGDLSHAVPPGVPAEELTVDLAAAQFYGEAGAAAAALGVSVDVFACAGPRWTGACQPGRVGVLWCGWGGVESLPHPWPAESGLSINLPCYPSNLTSPPPTVPPNRPGAS